MAHLDGGHRNRLQITLALWDFVGSCFKGIAKSEPSITRNPKEPEFSVLMGKQTLNFVVPSHCGMIDESSSFDHWSQFFK